MNILLVEDNEAIIKGLTYALNANNYNVVSVNTLDKIASTNLLNIDLIILDITLPDGNAYLYYKNNLSKEDIPVLFLSASAEESIIVDALNSGAEDYITKPFSIKELLARVNKIIRRCKNNTNVTIEDITFDMDNMIVYKNKKVINLTPLELKLLHLLFLNLNRVVTRDIILDKIYEWTGNDVDYHTVTVYYNRIREKLDTNIIKTVKGLGYRIDEK